MTTKPGASAGIIASIMEALNPDKESLDERIEKFIETHNNIVRRRTSTAMDG